MEDDDEGFVGYVPSTVDPGPVLLVVTVAICLFFLVVLPFAVIVGDKREQLKKGASGSATDADDEGDHDESKREQGATNNNDNPHDEDGDDDISVSSKGTYYSAISGAVKEILGNTGKPLLRSGGPKRHRRRFRGHLDRNQLLRDPTQYSIQFTNSQETDISSRQDNVPTSSHAKDESHNKDRQDEGIGISVSFEGKIQDEGRQVVDNCGVSAYGADIEIDGAIEGYEKPLQNRNVCLTMDGFLDEIAAIMAWDAEMKRIIKLSLPFATQAIFTGTLDILTVGVVGKLVGTREVSAFVIVDLLVSITTQFVAGFHEALATLCSQAIGAKKPRLAGKYVQIATTLYTMSYIPFAILWALYLDAAIRWFGFDEATVFIGHQYGYVLIVDCLFEGLGEGVHGLLDVAGFENYSTFIGALEELTAFLTILVWALVGSPSLLDIGLVQFGMGILFLSINVTIIWWFGWFQPYRDGMIGTCALRDKKAVWMVGKTAMSLSFGYLLTDGEWELLTIFASFLGPAEVAAWSILGVLWDAVNELIDGISDASEVRCAFLLGNNQPERARYSAYKSLMICVFTSLFLTSTLWICGEDLPTWLTNDPTLQHLVADLLPMFGIGNAAMCLGAMSWTLLGSQGRYRLATVIVFVVSWLVTLPLSAILSIHLNLSLEGQTSAVVLGYVLSGAIQAYYLFRSDWTALAQTVMDDNCSRASDDCSVNDVPTRSDENLETSERTLPRAGGQDDTAKGSAAAKEATSSPTESALPQRGNLPRPPSGRDNSRVYQHRGLPSPPSGEGHLFHEPVQVGTGEWKDATSADVEVELFAGSK